MEHPSLTYYRHPKTQTIHIVGKFPSPRGNGFSQCGQLTIALLKPMSRASVKKAKYHEFCNKCCSLLGLEN